MLPAIAAHRGWHADGAPENSIAALERAVAGGADAVEIDIRRTTNGTMVVRHDFHPGDSMLPGEATLDDWARRAGELGARVIAEFKEPGYEREALDAITRSMPRDHVELMSFDTDAVRALHELAPDRPLGLLTDLRQPAVSGAELVADARAVGANFLGLNVRQATPSVLDAAARANLDVKVWTVDKLDDIVRLSTDGRVGTIISDVPDLALGFRNLLRAATRH